jgi:hypothetical protein
MKIYDYTVPLYKFIEENTQESGLQTRASTGYWRQVFFVESATFFGCTYAARRVVLEIRHSDACIYASKQYYPQWKETLEPLIRAWEQQSGTPVEMTIK